MHATHETIATPRAQPRFSDANECLLVGAKEEIIGRIRHQHLLADIGEHGAASGWSRSSLRV